jgi:predicted alpha/beta hydrolase
MLAEAGYDVYLSNTRGNKYSMGHEVHDSVTSPEYWSNCIPDMQAKYDVPAFMETIKKVSNVDKMTIISHSIGSRSMLLNLE